MASVLDRILSHGPKTKNLTEEQAARSVVVTNIPPDTIPENIVIYFQRKKNGGGDIYHVHIPEEGTAVITFDSREVAEKVLKVPHEFAGSALNLHPLLPKELPEVFQNVEARAKLDMFHMSPQKHQRILDVLKENTDVACRRKGSEFYILSGTFSQIKTAHKLLQHLIKTKGANKVVQYGNGNKVEIQEDSAHGFGKIACESSSIPEPNSFEVQPQFMKLLKQVYKSNLQDIEGEFGVNIVWEENASQVCIHPRQIVKLPDELSNLYQGGCDAFIDLYQGFHPNIRREVVRLPDETNESVIRDAINFVQTENLAIIEKVEDSLVVYAEKDDISSSVRALKQTLSLNKFSASRNTTRGEGNKSRGPREYNEAQQQGLFPFPQRLNQVLKNGVSLSLYQGDITDEQVDAIVNAANEWLRHGAGVADAIVRKGGRQIQDESDWLTGKNGPVDVGEAVFTSGGNLSCRYVIHTVGPRWRLHGREKSISLLRRACLESLRVAAQLELSSIAFTAISSGIFGMPKEICAQVMFEAMEEFSTIQDVEFSTIRDVRVVIIDESTISVFHEEFVKRFCSQVAPSETVTRPGGQPAEERETSTPAESKKDLIKRSGGDSDDTEDKTNSEDLAPLEGQSKNTGLFESPSRKTGQDEESTNQGVIGDSGWYETPSNQGIENAKTKDVNLLFSDKTPKDGGTNEAVTNKDPAHTESSESNTKRPATRSTGRGRGTTLAVRFPGKENSSSFERTYLQEQSVHTVRGRGVLSKITTTATSPPGLVVTEEGVYLAKHLVNHEGGDKETDSVSVENKRVSEKMQSDGPSLKEGSGSQASECGKDNAKSIMGAPTEKEISGQSLFDSSNASTNSLPSREKINENPDSSNKEPVEGYEGNENLKQSTVKASHVKASGERSQKDQETIGKEVKEVPGPKTDAVCEGTMASNLSASQTTEKGLQTKTEGPDQKKSVAGAPHLSSDFQASPRSVDEITEDAANETTETLSQGSELGSSVVKEMYTTERTSEPDCLLCTKLSKDPVYPWYCGRSHYFCKSCIKDLRYKTTICPECTKLGLPLGNQPIGCMSWTTETHCSLPGYQDCGIIVVYFRFDKGIQGPEHPNPQQPYGGLFVKAFLPCNQAGLEVCRLLKTAFDARLVFKIGISPATGEKNVIVSNDIELKTSQIGGPANYAYPDPTYLDRVRSQLLAKGIGKLYP